MSNEPELLPCPLCGREATYYRPYYEEGWCPGCADIDCGLVIDLLFSSREEAAAAWNRRDWRPEDKLTPPRIEPMATP